MECVKWRPLARVDALLAWASVVACLASCAPPFPGSLASVPAGFTLPRQSISAVDPDFKSQSAWLSNVQVERALRSDMAVSVGYVHSIGRNLPVLMAVGITLGVIGITINFIISIVGVVLFLITLVRWIRETRESMAALPLEHDH